MTTLRERVPWALRGPVRRVRNAVAATILALRQQDRWRAIASATPRHGDAAISYGVEQMPAESEVVYGGAVKFQVLHREFPNAPRDFNVLYLGSSSMPVDASMLVRLARRRGAAFVWNQNGVAYPAWYGDGWQLVNRPRSRLLHEADYVVYQSDFCKVSADRFCGERRRNWEVLHNPVDVQAFVPARERPHRPLTLLLGGNQYQRYKVECAVQALAELRRSGHEARLLVAGELSFAPDAPQVTRALTSRFGVDDAVELVGSYSQADAPALLRSADVLLHPKYNDPCPTVVIEAMACGLPVVYSASGGTPELVGGEAGVGVHAPLDWDRDHPPEPAALAGAVAQVADELAARSVAARERAQRFDARKWVARHREIFAELVR